LVIGAQLPDVEPGTEGHDFNDVYWEWKFDFREHWARHAVEALKVAIFISPLA